MKKFNYFSIVLIIAGIFFINSSTFASTYTIDICDLSDPSPIETVTLWYTVSDDFNIPDPVELGDAIPAKLGMFGWLIDVQSVVNNKLTLAVSNWDYLMTTPPIENPMLNGTIFTFDYVGTINSLDLIGFANKLGEPVTVNLLAFDAEGTHFSAIPIPGAIFLFGPGLLGLIGLRRRMKK